ncbi:sigma-70 family RNA polymerase sigma factor [Singulisphaera sp. PoT]|uniref:sigma-70 family RNA polymerase sigma factor n=1 Tax=Singulisphaera sp. PoT TaxID=3411797 RepID=UPI003BF4E646
MRAMTIGPAGGSTQALRDLFSFGTAAGVDDGQLLARYSRSGDEAAFEALVTRHGPMVLATCRAVLGHEQDVEDAFQATFLVLARKAGSVRAGDALGGWLHRVAYRAAVQASASARRRRLLETEAAIASLRSAPAETEIPGIVHEELDRLPDRQRLPLILCDLEDLTYEQAAMRLGWTEPTLRHRLAAARQRIRDRLARRGLNAGAVGSLVGPAAGARLEVPAALIRLAVAGAGGEEGPAVSMIADGLMRIVLLGRLKFAAVGLALVVVTVATTGVLAVGDRSGSSSEAAKRRRAIEAKAKAPAEDGPGIEGRVIDLEGRPVEGARIELMNVATAPDSLKKWLERARDLGVRHPLDGLVPGSVPTINHLRRISGELPKFATTDRDGRFHQPGLGNDQVAEIRISGPTIATVQRYIMARDGAAVSALIRQGMPGQRAYYYPRQYDHVVTPTKPIQGVVQDRENGQPMAGVIIRAAVYDEQSLVPAPGISSTTDSRGAYRLDGLPRASSYRLFVDPGRGVPYPNVTLRIPGDRLTSRAVLYNVAIKRGVIVRGRVTEKETGEPVRASLHVYTFDENPHTREFPGYGVGNLSPVFTEDGRYEAVALPGRGIIGVIVAGYSPAYRTEVGVDGIQGYDPKFKGFRTLPHFCIASNYHTLAELNIPEGVESITLDLQVEGGRTIVVNPVDPEGRPVSDTTAVGINDRSAWEEFSQPTDSIKVESFDPSHPRRLTVRHASRGLIGSILLKGGEASPLTLRLEPSGTVIGRLVDEEGRPLGGLSVSSLNGLYPSRPAEQAIFPDGATDGGLRVGRDGRFRIEGLVPGLKYGAGTGEDFKYYVELFRDLVVKPGETRDLGDLKVVPPDEKK